MYYRHMDDTFVVFSYEDQTNRYSEHIIKSFVAKKIKQLEALPNFRPEKCPVYVRLPLLGSVSTQFEKQAKSAVKQCFSAVKPRVVCSTNDLFSTTSKDVLPTLQKSNVIYRLSCHCDRNSCRTELNNTSPYFSAHSLFSKNAYFLPVGVILPSRLIPAVSSF